MVSVNTVITAVGSVDVLANCTVDLIKDGGESVGGRWVEKDVILDEKVPAVEQDAAASEIRRFERGGERLENATRLYLKRKPSGVPDYVVLNGQRFKVFDWRFRGTRHYWRLLVARQI